MTRLLAEPFLPLRSATFLFPHPFARARRWPPSSVHQVFFCLFHQTFAFRDIAKTPFAIPDLIPDQGLARGFGFSSSLS